MSVRSYSRLSKGLGSLSQNRDRTKARSVISYVCTDTLRSSMSSREAQAPRMAAP